MVPLIFIKRETKILKNKKEDYLIHVLAKVDFEVLVYI